MFMDKRMAKLKNILKPYFKEWTTDKNLELCWAHITFLILP